MVPRGVLAVVGLFVAASVVRAEPASREADLRPVKTWSDVGRVNALAQTPDGFLWVGTDRGLFSFDGVRFVERRIDEGDAGSDVRSLVVDAQGALWVGLAEPGRLARLRSGRPSLVCTDPRWAHDAVQAIAPAGGDDVWLGTEKGAWRCHGHAVEGPAFGVSTSVTVLTLAGADVELMGGPERLFRVRDGRAEPVSDEGFSSSARDAGGSQWLAGAGRELYRWRHGAVETVLGASQVPSDIQSLAPARTGSSVWLGTRLGLMRVDATGETRDVPLARVLPDHRVSAVLEDREGNVWVGSLATGIAELGRPPITSLGPAEGVAGDSSFAVLEDAAGTVWAATTAGLVALKGREAKLYGPADRSLDAYCVRSVAADEALVWVATCDRGLWQGSAGVFHRSSAADGIPERHLQSVWRGRSGVLWVATESGLLYRRGRADAAFAPVPLGHEPCASSDGCLETIVAGVEARDGRSWWFGTAGGVVHRIDAATGGVLERTSRDDAHPSVFALYEDADGNLWIGGLRGLRVRQGGALRGFAGVHGIADQEINSIVEDATGDLWLGSGVGIWRVNRRELLAGSGARPLLYNHADGMTADRTARARAPAAIGARDGRIWFATELGLAIVDPAQARRSVPELSPIVERVRFDGTLAAERPLEPLRARPGRGDVDVEFTVPYFRAPHRLDLRYRLVGLDDGWRDGTSNRVARYTNLAPGSYRFVVRASADGVGASPTEAAIDLTIEPHFYQTKTAMLLALLSVAGIVAAVQRLRVAQVRARYSAIVLERMRIARDLHDTLAQSFAALSYQFRRLAQRLDGSPSETRSLLQDTQDLIARSRLEVRQAVGELRAHPAEDPTLVPALREMAKTAAALTGAHVDVVTPEGEAASPVVAPELRTEIARIAQEATTNAIVHGRATRVTVGVRALGDAVEVIVSDDGAGFDPDTNPPDSSLHFGLAGMRERAANIHADLTIDSAPGAGATVTLRAPIKSKGRS